MVVCPFTQTDLLELPDNLGFADNLGFTLEFLRFANNLGFTPDFLGFTPDFLGFGLPFLAVDVLGRNVKSIPLNSEDSDI